MWVLPLYVAIVTGLTWPLGAHLRTALPYTWEGCHFDLLQMVWALAVGLTLSLLPAFSDGRSAGFNLLLFFGALYVIRGLGVLVWISKGRYVFIIVLSLIPQGVLLLGALALALGLGDTWLDIRKRARAT